MSVACCVAILPEAHAMSPSFRPVLLDRGVLLQHEWAVGVVRHDGRKGRWRPCLLERVSDFRNISSGEGNFSNEMVARVCARLPVDGPPNIMSLTAGEGRQEMTVFSMAFVPRVRSVWLDFGPNGSRRVRLKIMNKDQARVAQVRPIRFAAFAIKGDPCLAQVKGFGVGGGEIYTGPIDACPSSTRVPASKP